MRNDFDHSENYYLVEGLNLWWGENKNVLGGSLLGGIFPGGEMSKFLATGGRLTPIHSPVGKTLVLHTLLKK